MYVVVVVLSMAGDQVPVIPLLDVVGKAGIASPEQYGPTALKVGVVHGLTTTSVVTGSLVIPPIVTTIVYVPDIATVAFGRIGFIAVDVQPPGPDH